MISRVSPSSSFVTTGYLAKTYGFAIQTVINIVESQPGIETTKTMGGHRRVSDRDFRVYLGLEEPTQKQESDKTKVLVVVRVSSQGQKGSLAQQEKDCRAWVAQAVPNAQIEVSSRIASGLLLDHPEFIKIIDGILARQWDVVVCRTSERMCRSALCLVKKLCERSDIEFRVVDDTNKSWSEEMAEDILALCGSAHAKFNGNKTKKLLQIEVAEDVLKSLYQMYTKQHMSLKEIVAHCEANGITGTKGQAIKEGKLRRLLEQNKKTLRALDEDDTQNSLTLFLKSHVRNSPTGEIAMRDFEPAYARFCGDQGLAILGRMRLTGQLKELGWYDEGCTKRHSVKGYRVFLGRVLN